MQVNVFFRKLLISTLLIIITNTGLAFSGNWLVGLAGGASFQALQNSTFTIPNGSNVAAPYNLDTFSIKDPATAASIAVLGGYQWQRVDSFLPFSSLTLHYEHQTGSKIKGTIQEYGLPLFTNYNYSMQLQSDIVSVVGKLDLVQYGFVLPYFSAGLGVTSNQLNHYYEQPIPSVNPGRLSPNYNSSTNTNFMYSLGAGLDFIGSQSVWFALGYQFMDLGKITSGSGSGTWSSTKLNFGKLRSHTIALTGTYLFN